MRDRESLAQEPLLKEEPKKITKYPTSLKVFSIICSFLSLPLLFIGGFGNFWQWVVFTIAVLVYFFSGVDLRRRYEHKRLAVLVAGIIIMFGSAFFTGYSSYVIFENKESIAVYSNAYNNAETESERNLYSTSMAVLELRIFMEVVNLIYYGLHTISVVLFLIYLFKMDKINTFNGIPYHHNPFLHL